MSKVRDAIASTLRTVSPMLLLIAGIGIAFAIGASGASHWFILIPAVLGGSAIGLAQDRAEARAKAEWADRFLRMVEDDHEISVSVTHHHPREGI